MRQLANHLPPCAVLNEQRVFATDSRAAGDIGHFDQQIRAQARMFQGRHAEIDDAVFGMNFSRPEPKLGCVRLAGVQGTPENVLEFRIVIHQLQEWSAARPVLANAEQVFGGGVQFGDQEVLIEKYNAGI